MGSAKLEVDDGGSGFAAALVHESSDGLIALATDGTIRFWNQGAQAIFGYSSEECLGRTLESLIIPEDRRDEAQAAMTEVLDRGVALFETERRRKDGARVSIDVSLRLVRSVRGDIEFIAASHKDISQVRALREECAAEAKFRGLLEAAPDAMVIVGDDGRIALINSQTEKLFGYRRDELLGQPVELLVPEHCRRSHPGRRNAGATPLRARSIDGGLDLYGRRKDGSEFPCEISLAPMESESGRLVTAAIRDITGRKHLEERMQQASRLKNEFLANMSHELRTPLNAIIGFAELMHYEEVEPGSAEQKEFLVHILTSGRHLLQLVNDILDLSKIEAGKMEFRPEPIDLRTVVQEVVGMLSATVAGKRIDVGMSVEDLGDVQLDPARLKQVLYNYLSNALKFTPEGGRVMVQARAETPQTFRIEVEDTGVGIRASDLGHLFVEFHQLDGASTKRHPGTGLGLALTKRIVDAQGGSVGVSSALGEGSVFHAILPRRSRLTVHVPQPATLKGLPGNGPAILVIDDDDADRDLLVRTLGGAGYAVKTAITAIEGLGMLRAGNFDAVTIHLSLPDVSGLKVLQEIRRSSRTAQLPVVLVTVVNETGAVSGFAAQDVLPKPPEAESLVAALERVGIRRGQPGSVLVVDGDPACLAVIKRSLQEFGLRAICRHDAKAALLAAEAVVPNAVILDLLMPQMDGFEFLERFRDSPENRDVPVFICTAQDLAVSPGADAHHGQITVKDHTHVLLSRAGGNMAELLQEMKRVLPRRSVEERDPAIHVGRTHLDR